MKPERKSGPRIALPPVLQSVVSAMENTPWKGDVFVVGGYVRDALLNLRTMPDIDLVTTGDAPALALHLHAAGLTDHFPTTYANFGTAMVQIQGHAIELVTARKESYRGTSRKPSVEPASYVDDAIRRDFTVNTLRASIETGEVIDSLGTGIADLNKRVLRTPTDAERTFDEDPLRMLRAIRFKARLGFAYAPELEIAIRHHADRLRIVSAERIRDELNKILLGPEPDIAFNELQSFGLFRPIVPELDAMVGVEQGSFHHLDVWHHTLLVLRNLGANAPLNLRWAAMLHDVAKPQTRTVDHAGRVRFFNHEIVGEDVAKSILRRLKFSEKDVRQISHWVRGHMRVGTASRFTPTAARRLVRDFGDDTVALLDLVDADAASLKPGVRVLNTETVRETVSATLQATPPEKLISPLTGAEIMALTGLPAGKEIGRLKAKLSEAVILGQLDPNNREAAVAFLQSFHQS